MYELVRNSFCCSVSALKNVSTLPKEWVRVRHESPVRAREPIAAVVACRVVPAVGLVPFALHYDLHCVF